MDIPDFENHYKARKIILIDLTHHSGLFTNYYESNNRSSITNDYLIPAITAPAQPALWRPRKAAIFTVSWLQNKRNKNFRGTFIFIEIMT